MNTTQHDTNHEPHAPTQYDEGAFLPALPRFPSKAQEEEHVRAFVAMLPRSSYLADMLRQLPALCAQEIRNDWTFPVEIANAWQARHNAEEELAALRAEIREERKALDDTKAQARRARCELIDACEALQNAATSAIKSAERSKR
jgi:hypothetical protein